MSPDQPPAILPFLRARGRDGAARTLLFGGWLLAAAWFASCHVVWRDEARALTLALQGDGVAGMLRRIQGEGHPAVWYLLLRGAYAVAGVRQVLPGVAFAVGTIAAGLWTWRAPFRPAVIGLALFGAFLLVEYTVSARNYGIAVVGLFAFAALYGRWRRRGPGLGLILAMTCNTNVPAALLAGALGLFWGVELLAEEGWRWSPAKRHWLGNMALALAGVGACLATVYPPYNDAAVQDSMGILMPGLLLLVLTQVAQPFSALMPTAWWGSPLASLALTATIIGPVLGLLRAPAALVAGVAGTIALQLMFQLIYPGEYRHEALLIAFDLVLYWLAAEGFGARWRAPLPIRPALALTLQRGGQGALAALLAVQVLLSAQVAGDMVRGRPWSQSYAAAQLLRREGLERAVVLASPDVLVEPLAQYTHNPLWLVRARRWGAAAPFTIAAQREVTYAELLATARALRAHTHRPVVILLHQAPDPAQPETVVPQGYLGTLRQRPEEARAFLAATRRLAWLAPAETDETYGVYRLTGP